MKLAWQVDPMRYIEQLKELTGIETNLSYWSTSAELEAAVSLLGLQVVVNFEYGDNQSLKTTQEPPQLRYASTRIRIEKTKEKLHSWRELGMINESTMQYRLAVRNYKGKKKRERERERHRLRVFFCVCVFD